jgi:uncharacterized membrane protein
MPLRPDNLLVTAAGFGALAGMRSLSAPAFLSHRLEEVAEEAHPAGRPLSAGVRLLSSPFTSRLLRFLAAGEMAADKSRWIPRRVDPLPLAGRVLIGGAIGALLASRSHRARLGPLVVGGVAAALSSYGLYHLRRLATRRLPLPDPVVGIVEDGVVMALGNRLESVIH